jgi:hypothetical protein
MHDRLYLVLSAPPEGVSQEEYESFYHRHIRENMAQPGFYGGRRYRVEPPPGDGMPQHTHAALYNYDGDLDGMIERLTSRIDSGEIYLPDWFGGIKFQTLDATPLEPYLEAGSA